MVDVNLPAANPPSCPCKPGPTPSPPSLHRCSKIKISPPKKWSKICSSKRCLYASSPFCKVFCWILADISVFKKQEKLRNQINQTQAPGFRWFHCAGSRQMTIYDYMMMYEKIPGDFGWFTIHESYEVFPNVFYRCFWASSLRKFCVCFDQLPFKRRVPLETVDKSLIPKKKYEASAHIGKTPNTL